MTWTRTSMSPLAAVSLGMLVSGCPDVTGEQAEVAKAAVEQGFAAANPAGRTGVEFSGRPSGSKPDVRQVLPREEGSRLQRRRPDPAPGISAADHADLPQPALVHGFHGEGFLHLPGGFPQLTVDDVSWGGDAFRVSTTVTMAKASPWFECLDEAHKKRQFRVTVNDGGEADIEGQRTRSRVRVPIPSGWGTPRARQGCAKVPHAAPSMEDVLTLARALDDALHDGDFGKVQSMTACYNLEDSAPHFGTCSVAEFLMLGPAFHGEQRAQDGTPWTEYTIRDLDELQRIVPDRNLKGVYHVTMTHRRTKRDRSFAVQWADDQWKMVGVIGKKAESLTNVRYVYDLHRKDKNEVFRKRLEEIDEAGNPLNPGPSRTEAAVGGFTLDGAVGTRAEAWARISNSTNSRGWGSAPGVRIPTCLEWIGALRGTLLGPAEPA